MLVTTYRHARFVEECLESLRAQSSRDFEVIITDDASPDGTADRIEAWLDRTGFPARFIRNPVNRGICANRNAALALARGEFICSLSGDDAYLPDRIERQLQVFAEAPKDVAAVYGDALLMDADSQSLSQTYLHAHLGNRPPPADVFSALLVGDNFLPAPAVMVRRSAIADVGGYDEGLFYEDLDMWLRLSHRFRFQYLPGCVMRYRMLADSMSHGAATKPAMLETEFRVFAGWIDRAGDAANALHARLWFLAAKQVALGRDDLARRMMTVVAATNPRWHRRLAASLAALPGGCSAFRHLGLA